MIEERPRVMLVVPTLRQGGAERVASLLSRGLAERFDLTLVLHDASGRTYDHGGTIVDLGCRSIDDKRVSRRLWNTLRAVFLLRRLKKRLRPEAVISFLELSNIPNILSGRRMPLLVSVRSHRLESTDKSLQRRIANILVSILYGRASRVVAVSEGVRRHLNEDFGLGADRLSVIYNPYNTDALQEMGTEPPEPFDQGFFDSPVVATTGRLTLQKGHWHLIRAFARVREAVPGAKLVIMGEGNLRPYLEGLVSGMGLSGSVFMPGFVSNPFAVISRSSLFVFPSLWEGFPNALVEAMACGVPVLAADCASGPREILRPGAPASGPLDGFEPAESGGLLPVFDGNRYGPDAPLAREEEVWAGEMVRFLGDSALRSACGRKARDRAADFSWSRSVEAWAGLVREVSGQG